MDLQFRDNEQQHRYEALDGDAVAAYAVYSRHPDADVVTHTQVDSAYEGKGVASQLVQHVLGDVREQGRKVVPECPFVRRYVGRHWEEYQDVVVGMEPPSA